MAMTIEELNVIIDAKTKPFVDAINQVETKLAKTNAKINSTTTKISTSFSKVAKTIARNVAIVGAGVTLFGASAVKIASDLQEVQNVVDVSFGNMSYKVEQFAQNSLKQFGLSELQAKRTASTYMAMSSSMGIASNAASDMSIKVAALSGDMASFFNVSQSVADTALKSIWTGETESLKQFGVVMTEVNLKQFAMEQGITKSYQAMSQAEKVMLRYQYVTSTLSLAQGDFARTSGNWANQIRLLQGQFQELMGIIGNGFIAFLTPVVKVINTVLEKLLFAARVLQSVFGGSKKAKTNTFTDIASSADIATGAVSSVGDAAQATAKKLGSLAGFDDLNVLSSTSNAGSGGSGGGSVGGGGGFDFDTGGLDFEGPDTSAVEEAANKVKAIMNGLKDFLVENKAVILSVTSGILAGFTAFGVIKGFPAIVTAITTVTSGVKLLAGKFLLVHALSGSWLATIQILTTSLMGLISPVVAISAVIGAVTAALVYLYQTSTGFRDIVNTAFQSLMDILSNLYTNVLTPLFTLLADMFNTIIKPIALFITDVFVVAVEFLASVVLSFWNNVLAPVVDFLVSVLSIALQGVVDVWNGWKPAIELIMGVIGKIWNEMLKPLVDFIKNVFIAIFESFGETIETIMPSVEAIFQGFVDFLVGVFTLDIDKVMKGIEGIFNGFSEFFNTIFTTNWTEQIGVIGNVLDGWLTSVEEVFEGVKTTFGGIIDFVTGVFEGDWEKAWNGVVDIFKGIFNTLGGIIKAPLNTVIGIVNTVIDSINGFGFDIPDWVPVFGGNKFRVDVPKLQYLARGGVVNSATPAIIGEYGKEVVMPLERNTGWITQLSDKIASRMPMLETVENTGGQYTINIVLENGEILATHVINNIKDIERRTGKPVLSY